MPEGIVIDDLDTGFTVEARHDGSRIRGRRATAIGGRDREFDEGLPDYTRQPGDWSRVSIPSSWGKYRHTVAGAIAGDGSTVGIFAADLPAPGRWQLDYHIPNRVGMGQNIYPSFGTLGHFRLVLRLGGKDTAIGFDGASAEVGWNRIGEYELPASEVRLEVSSQTDGEMVVADAIRWIRVE